MSEALPTEGQPPPTNPVTSPKTPANTLKYTLALVLLLVAVAGGVYAYVHFTTPLPPPVDELRGLKAYIENLSRTQKLAAEYTDANGDLVADAPAGNKFLAVNELVFSVVGSDYPVKAQGQWKDFMAALRTATGKPVKYASDLLTVEEQQTALREGRLHVTAFNTGQVSAAVNTSGFVPLCCPADATGRYAYEMEILVRPDSPVRQPQDLKRKVIGLVALSSNSGGKAPLVVLKEKFGMLPGRDYSVTFTGDHTRSIKELVRGQHDAVCVANDLLARAVAAGEVKPEQYRSVYKSDPFPPLCFGVPHNLPPDLRAKVEQAFATFKFANTSVEDQYRRQGYVQFAKVEYARDWKLIREVDEALAHLLDEKK